MRVRKSAINLIWLEQVHTTRPCFKNLLSIMYFLPPGWKKKKKKKVRMVSKYTSGFIRGELTTQKVTVTWCRSLKYAHKLWRLREHSSPLDPAVPLGLRARALCEATWPQENGSGRRSPALCNGRGGAASLPVSRWETRGSSGEGRRGVKRLSPP